MHIRRPFPDRAKVVPPVFPASIPRLACHRVPPSPAKVNHMCSIQKWSVNKMVCQSMVPTKCGIRIKDDCYAKLSHFRSAALGKLVTLHRKTRALCQNCSWIRFLSKISKSRKPSRHFMQTTFRVSPFLLISPRFTRSIRTFLLKLFLRTIS